MLESVGYETMMVMIYVSPITSLERNAGRDRSLLPGTVLQTWEKVNSNIPVYQKEFGDNFILINNDPKDAKTDFDAQELAIKLKHFETFCFCNGNKFSLQYRFLLFVEELVWRYLKKMVFDDLFTKQNQKENLYSICNNDHKAYIHLSCFSNIIENDKYRCPICR